jgi:hypothetical protein
MPSILNLNRPKIEWGVYSPEIDRWYATKDGIRTYPTWISADRIATALTSRTCLWYAKPYTIGESDAT